MTNKDTEVPKKIAREKHLSAVKDFTDLMDSQRDLTVIAFDRDMGQVDVLVNFNGMWVRCSVIYNQPVFCKRISTIPGIIDVDESTRPVRLPQARGESIKVNFIDSATIVIPN